MILQSPSLITKSLMFLLNHKKLLFFPLLATILSLSAAVLWGTFFYDRHKHEIDTIFTKKSNGNNQSVPITDEYPSGLFFVELTFLIILLEFTKNVFFGLANIGLSYTTAQIFRDGPVSLYAGILRGMQCLLPTRLLLWALIDSIESPEEYIRGLSQSLLFSSIIKNRWDIATFIVIPIMAHEQVSAPTSIRTSAKLIEKTFGKQLTNTVQPMQGILGLIIFPLLFLLMISIFSFGATFFSTEALILIFICSAFAIIMLVCAILSAVITVLREAIYHYTIDSPFIGPFTAQELQSSFIV